MAFKRELANNERFYKGSDDVLQLDTSVTAYEVYIELGRDKPSISDSLVSKDMVKLLL